MNPRLKKLIVRLCVISLLILLLTACGSTDEPSCESSVYVVTKTEDTIDGVCTTSDCSLREAILMANFCEGEQGIYLPAGLYTLTRTGADEDRASTGDLDILDDLIIEGMEAVVDGGGIDRVFDIQTKGSVEMRSITIQNGNLGTSSNQHGGGIRNAGTLMLNDVEVSRNTARVSGGIHNTGSTQMVGGRLEENIGHGAIYNDWGEMSLQGVTIRTVPTSGNWYAVGNNANLIMEDVTVQGHAAEGCSADYFDETGLMNGSGEFSTPTIRLERVRVFNFCGVAISNFLPGGQITIVDSSVEGNLSGGLVNVGTAFVERTTFSGNGAGTPYLGSGYPLSTIFNGNSLTLTNVTISGNSFLCTGSCAVVLNMGSLSLSHVTLFDNDLPGLITQEPPVASGSLITRMDNSIIAGNSGPNCQGETVLTGGNNLLDDGTCSTFPVADTLVLSPADIMILPLDNYGGMTHTHALLPDSPAIDAASGDCPAIDQRGVGRPIGEACDIGAYEAGFETVSEPILVATPEATEAFSPSLTFSLTFTPQAVPITPTFTITPKPPTPSFTPQPPQPTHTPTATLKPSPPAAPGKLAIIKRVCDSQEYSVTLGWIDNANNEDGYRVYRGKVLIATLKPNTTSYKDNPPGSGPYTYGVEAFNAAGSSSRPTVYEEGCLY